MISIISTQTKHLSRIVGDLVEVTRDKLQTTAISRNTIGVAALVDSATGMLTNGASTANITTHIPAGLTLTGDGDPLRQVLVNYLTNAGRYGNGQVQVQVHAMRSTSGDTIVEVHDNGPGIPKKCEVTIWDRFERGAQTYMSQVQGSGLGLAIARQLVAATAATPDTAPPSISAVRASGSRFPTQGPDHAPALAPTDECGSRCLVTRHYSQSGPVVRGRFVPTPMM